MLRVLCLALFVVGATPAFADRADADACAVRLSGLARDTYNASIDDAARGSTLRQAIGGYLKPLYDAGRVTESQARKHGYAAAMCVRLVHRKTRRNRYSASTAPPASYGTRAAAEKSKARAKPRFRIGDDDDDD